MVDTIKIPTTPIEFFSLVSNNKEKLERNQFNKNKKHSDIVINEAIKQEINSLTITEEEVKNILGRKWKHNLALIGAFINTYQYLTSDKEIRPIIISTTGEFMVNLCGTSRNAAMLVEKMLQLKLLTKSKQIIEVEKLELTEDGEIISKRIEKKEIEYSYKRKLSTQYFYSKRIQNILKEIIVKEEIVIKQEREESDSDCGRTKVEGFDNKDFIPYIDRVKITSNTSIPCIAEDMASLIFPVLYNKYPQLHKFQQIAIDMNKNLNSVNKIKFKPDLKYDKSRKYVKKISIRATNPLVSAKKDKEHVKENFCGKFRDEVLQEQLGDIWSEFDVKSSIPRVAVLSNYGVWLDQDIDLYYEMYKEMYKLLQLETVSYEEYKKLGIREYFKDMFMRVAFDKSPAKMASNVKGVWNNTEVRSRLTEEQFEEYNNEMKRIAKEYFTAYLAAAKKVLGGNLDTELFLHESCIYLLVAKKIREMGIKLVQVYDGFYTDKKVENIEKIVEDCALEYYSEFLQERENEKESDCGRTKVEGFEKEGFFVSNNNIIKNKLLHIPWEKNKVVNL
jgi:hypothetical protein